MWRTPHRASHWHSCRLMSCKNSHKYKFYLVSTKICHKVAFNDIYNKHNKQRRFQHPVIDFNMELTDLNMELIIKIVNDFKQYTIFAKGSILDVSQAFQRFYEQQKNYITVFGTVSPTTLFGFYMFKVNDRNTENTRARCITCLKIIVRTPKRRQWH